MMMAQVDPQEVTDDAVSTGRAAPSRPLSILPAGTKPTNPHDKRQKRPLSGSTARCPDFGIPVGEVLQRMTGCSADDLGTQLDMGNPGQSALCRLLPPWADMHLRIGARETRGQYFLTRER